MRVQVNSDNTVSVDVRVKQFVKDEVERILEHFADRVTRVQVHLSDVNSRKSGPADKRCLVEVRPAGAQPLSTNATGDDVPTAIVQALRKMKRSLTSAFGRQGRALAPRTAPAPRATARAATPKTADGSPKPSASKATTIKKTAVAKAAGAATSSAPARSAATKKVPASRKTAASAETTTAPVTSSGRTPKKKAIFQARRMAWPTR
jgi:ribosome-associated translation inhibitor RaiA